MSGGSYEYAYQRVRSMADDLRRQDTNPLRAAFANHLQIVADAMYAVEWVDSGDKGPGDENAAIRACLSPGAELESAIKMAEAAMVTLSGALEEAIRLRSVVKP